ncbi:glutaredoxin family protein [Candidatus Woesearchaeota archaeon]|nr:glutaredoxin family protein [Candidatus Woesearchaeota archaeon]
MTKEVIVYSTPACPYCRKIKEWLHEHNIAFREINVAEDPDAAKKMIEESGQAGVPVLKIVENNQIKKMVVGYDIEALEEEFSG